MARIARVTGRHRQPHGGAGVILKVAARQGVEVVLPVVAIDRRPIGDGRPGPVVRRLMALYGDDVRSPAADLPENAWAS